MPRLSEAMLLAFRDELNKEAGFAGLVAKGAPMLRRLGAGAGVGALGGGLVGGVAGGLHGYTQARDEGNGVGTSALHGLLGASSGALSGGLVGGALGGAAGAAGLHADQLGKRNDVLGSFARSGQRQVHSLTGMLSPSELSSDAVRGGAYAARQNLESLRAAGKPLGRATRAVEHANKAEKMGLTSIPGYASALGKYGPRKVLETGAKEQYYNLGAPGLALTGALVAPGIVSAFRNDGTGGGGEQVGRSVGEVAGATMGGLMPFAGQSIMQSGLGSAGAGVGRVIDRIRGRHVESARYAKSHGVKPMVNDLGQPSTLEPTESQNTPSERVMSPSAAGGQKDIGL